jgi:UTP--glucose-1-phosphate uridylyltransferase
MDPSKIEDAEELPRMDSSADFRKRGGNRLLLEMRRELGQLVESRASTQEEADKFFSLFSRYLESRFSKIEWEKINPTSSILSYGDISSPSEEEVPGLLDKLAVLKLNGGLGTSMGCVGPKSAIEVREHLNFLDLSVRQMEHLNEKYKTSVPLVLMNSFSTEEQTKKMIGKYENIFMFTQSAFPRIYADTLLPVPSDTEAPAAVREKEGWYPPGHGDLFSSLVASGMVDRLLGEGKEYLFISNIDNLKATVDLAILKHVHENGVEFLMEVTNKTRADIKGGTLIEYEGKMRLLEIAQVPEYHKTDFTSIRKFKIFNTNSVWVSIAAIKRLMEAGGVELDVIENKKKLSTGERVVQLETALGAAIRHFNNAQGIVVPRSRFLPVKTCSDLFIVQSDIFKIKHGTLVPSGQRVSEETPIIRLAGKWFKGVEEYQKRVKGSISLADLDHLTVHGNVFFGKNITLKGTVIIMASEEGCIHIPEGSILDDKIVHGNMSVIDH